ncbi:hypothetical protein KAI46_03985 [bacterium]|nr:hypothetical protein [bacterium]
MANVWTKFKQLLPNNAQQVGVVETVHLDGTTTIELPGGSKLRVIGEGVGAGNSALIEGNRIITEVPSLPTSSAEV